MTEAQYPFITTPKRIIRQVKVQYSYCRPIFDGPNKKEFSARRISKSLIRGTCVMGYWFYPTENPTIDQVIPRTLLPDGYGTIPGQHSNEETPASTASTASPASPTCQDS